MERTKALSSHEWNEKGGCDNCDTSWDVWNKTRLKCPGAKPPEPVFTRQQLQPIANYLLRIEAGCQKSGRLTVLSGDGFESVLNAVARAKILGLLP